MRYLGGKSKIRKQVAEFLESVREGRDYFEPFVGGGWILQEMSETRIASDGNIALITLYKALQEGWEPPDFVSEFEYGLVNSLRDVNDPLTAFVGFGCSFGGKWFGGYARSNGKSCYAATSKQSLIKQLPLIKDVTFVHGTYDVHTPHGMLIYCDPPYANTTSYGAFDGFDHDHFWETVREWCKTNTVVVSEYKAPEDFTCVREFVSQMGLSSGDASTRSKRIERVFMHNSQRWKAFPEWMRPC